MPSPPLPLLIRFRSGTLAGRIRSTVLSYTQTEKRDTLMGTQFAALSAMPQAEWFANLRNRHPRENYERDSRHCLAFTCLGSVEQLREVTRPHVLAWRDHLYGR